MKFIARAIFLCVLLTFDHTLAQAQRINAAPAPAQASGESGLMLVQQAAEHGDPVAQMTLGDARARARGLFKSYFEAVKWYRLAAEQGLAPAQYRLGGCLLQGDGGKHDPAEAYTWFQKAAAQEDVNSIHMIGRFHEEGWGNVTTNHAEAARWYLKSAAYGQIFSLAQLGKLYASGRGVPKDAVEAMKWFYLADQIRTAETNRIEPPVDYDAARRTVMDHMKMAETDEARRRAARFVFTPRPATSYQITYWKANTPPPPPVETARPSPTPLARPSPAVPAAQASADLVIEVPLQMENNRPYVSVKINGSRTARLLFDSGAGASLIVEKTAAKLKLKPTAKIEINGQHYDALQGVHFALGGASFTPPLLAVHPGRSMLAIDSFSEGIIGADLLQNFVVEIDYRNNKLRLRDPLRYKYTGPGDYLLMRFDHGRPYIDARVFDGLGKTTSAQFLIDTGATGALFLESHFWQSHRIKESIGGAVIGKTAGIEGAQRVSMGELNGLQMGHYYIPRPKTVFREGAAGPGAMAGLIGGDILRRFTVIFHYGRQQLILIPNGTPVQPATMTDSASVLNQ